MIPVHELKAPAVGCSWHEVAALVLDAATALHEQPASDLRNLAGVHLAEEGYVALPAGPAQAWPVLQLARLLDDLLAGMPAPEALRAIATRHRNAPPSEDSLETFVTELARFERPDRAGVLAQLAARAAAVDRDVDGTHALAELESRVREHEASVPAPASPRSAGTRRRGGLVAGAVVVAVAVAVFLALAYVSAPRRPESAGPQPITERVKAGAAELVASAARVLQPAPAPSPEAQPTAAPGTTHPPDVRGGRRRATPRTMTPDPVVSLRWLDDGTAPPAPEGPIAAPAAESDATIYTSADAGVTPAALLRPHIPTEPPSSVAADDVGTLELTVTETGQVSHVALVSTTNRYQERMLVAAAKTWRFTPALKNGHPVRFRARVRITV